MKRFGLPKSSLLKKTSEFNLVYRKGKRFKSNGFTLISLPNGLEYNRIGVSVHRKIRGAVYRNRIKRIIRESFRLYRNKFPERGDIVFAVNRNFQHQNPDSIRKAIEDLNLHEEKPQYDRQQ